MNRNNTHSTHLSGPARPMTPAPLNTDPRPSAPSLPDRLHREARAWQVATPDWHPIYRNRCRVQGRRLGLESTEPEAPSPHLRLRQDHEARLLARDTGVWIRGLTDPGALAQWRIDTLKQTIADIHTCAQAWGRLLTQLKLDGPASLGRAGKVIDLLCVRIADALDGCRSLPDTGGLQTRLQTMQEQALRDRQHAQAMEGFLRRVAPSDGRWEREPPTVAEVLLMMEGDPSDTDLVQARLADGQRPVDIVCQHTPVTLQDIEQTERDVATLLRQPHLRMALQELQLLLSPPRVPLQQIAAGQQQGLTAAETRAMHLAGVPINRHTAPDRLLALQLMQAEQLLMQPLGKGNVNTVSLVRWNNGAQSHTFTWRPEIPDADTDAMVECGLPSRPLGQPHARAPRLAGRQMLTGRLAGHLGMARHITVTQAQPAVLSGVYGTLNDYLPQLERVLLDRPQPVALPANLPAWLQGLPDGARAVLQPLAQRHGLYRLELTDAGLLAVAAHPQVGREPYPRELVRPLDHGSARVRCQFTVATWLHLLTAQVDGHPGNIAFVTGFDERGQPQPRLALFDNDLAFSQHLLHPEDACNNRRQQPPGPRVQADRSALHGTRFPGVIPHDLADALLQMNQADLIACGAADLLNAAEYRALRSRLGHVQAEIRRMQRVTPPCVLRSDADWHSPETTQRLGLADVDAQADAVAATVMQPPGKQVDTRLLREVESDGLLRLLAVYQTVALRHPQQAWFPVLFDPEAIVRDVQQAFERHT